MFNIYFFVLDKTFDSCFLKNLSLYAQVPSVTFLQQNFTLLAKEYKNHKFTFWDVVFKLSNPNMIFRGSVYICALSTTTTALKIFENCVLVEMLQ